MSTREATSTRETTPAPRPYRGVFPVAPTIFHEDGTLDLDGQRRAIDFMIEAGAHGLCILANFSEQFVLTDAERDAVMTAVLAHVAGRVPVIVTTTHFATHICAERSRRAQDLGAAMVMIMPPYHGATIRVTEAGIERFFQAVSDAISIPIMIQDAPVSGTTLSAAFLARLAREVANVSYFKIETAQAAAKLRTLLELGGDAIEGPWDGEEAITLLADLDAGATGAMTGGGYPDGIRRILDPYLAGRRDEAVQAYGRWLPLINYENRQTGLAAAKILMKEGGIIRSDAVRAPLELPHPATRAGLIEIARSLDAAVLRWGR
ncbi:MULTISPECIES: dihydrodipicolinate synthase family protein [Methylobacterium]|jgi:2-keto-3-deoxy-L-arabinonate dehydratase|uniref:dihydrodipicolinate synthase family protein n=1 Tax=Methylobacterium TaxID=407 RepID=UPI0008E0F1BD|nr:MULTISPECIES: dihydrodipicolinate synthase family protein [Methylobacterium]MBZ6416201.1 dihydrodipicolinate synthase family protein [Methylobacterium sp.]MBK3399355.1 dihydrodipicolinate synthase family protein [Methylobacterium ajmalii]MBK3409910.1 dihydrodipicolinate synthase family protein [Methylobacterium ajmalii]MBK3422879.1 dihydrodipicolinate synthase family protein [Methylobacterium ajmalii]SFF63445.1 4-hydroxy-tetrahydrodipicolinate synthase [Methylobacterium sp. yr596]